MDTMRRQQELVGVVVSDKMMKTRVVRVEWRQNHKMFHKKVSWHGRYLVHDEKNQSGVGDTVRIMSCRPLSKYKHFRVVQVVSKRES